MNRCPECGTKVNVAMNYCPICGYKLAAMVFESKRNAWPVEKPRPVATATLLESVKTIDSSRPVVIIQPISAAPPAAPPVPVYYTDRNVRLTAAELILPGNTVKDAPLSIPLADINAVNIKKQRPNPVPAVLMIALGIICFVLYAYMYAALLIIGGCVFVLGGVAVLYTEPTYHLMLGGAFGEADIFHTNDQPLMMRIVASINLALLRRPKAR